ncbi:MAG: transcriptional regulator [Methanobacteriaceae archaeon]
MIRTRPPCEIVVWYVIPGIRAELAKELLRLGMKQKQISELLDITQPAVSQYISDKRGHGIKFDEHAQNMIRIFARDLMDQDLDQADIIRRTCEICKNLKAGEIVCQLHKEKDKIPSSCSACMGSQRDIYMDYCI